MKTVTLVAVAAVAGIALGGVALAGMQAMENRQGATQSVDPMTRARAEFARACAGRVGTSGVNRRRCDCLTNAVAQEVFTPFEFQLASTMTKAILTKRSYLAKERLQASLRRIWKKNKDKISQQRANAIWNTVRFKGLHCARTVQ